MGLSEAERKRRYRRHNAGDHSLCDPARCPDVVPTPPITRGAQFVDDLKAGLDTEHMALLIESGRIIDRLDRFNAILDGDRHEWLRFRIIREGIDEEGEVTVRANVTGVLAEARQQATELRGLVAQIAKAKTAKPAAPTGVATGGIFGLADELAPRRKSPSA